MRQDYEKTIRQNKEKATRYKFQLDLKQLGESVEVQALRHIIESYDKTPEDAAELTAYMETFLHNRACEDEMKSKLHELLEFPPAHNG